MSDPVMEQVDELADFVAGKMGSPTPAPDAAIEQVDETTDEDDELEVEDPDHDEEPVQDAVDTDASTEVEEGDEEGDAEGVEGDGDEPSEIEAKLTEALARISEVEGQNANLFAMLNDVPLDPLLQASAVTDTERGQAQTPAQGEAQTQPAAPVTVPAQTAFLVVPSVKVMELAPEFTDTPLAIGRVLTVMVSESIGSV